jgi:hypothetical protein
MKKLIFLLFVCCMICNAGLAGQGTTTREIIIIETSPTPPILKSTPAVPVKARITVDEVKLLFQGNLGTVTITIAGAQGVVYQTTVAATEDAELTIDVQGWEVGDYTIEIVRSSGQTFAGEFELQDENS